jgi:hypothetical protein
MKMATLFLIAVLAATTPAAAQEETTQAAAETVTRAWLTLVDSGQYEASWDKAASFFRAAITPEDWVQALSGARAAFGAVLGRDTISTEHTKTLPGAPDGEYVVFQFRSSFENKANAVETVTAMKDLDGKWRVAGYFVR